MKLTIKEVMAPMSCDLEEGGSHKYDRARSGHCETY